MGAHPHLLDVETGLAQPPREARVRRGRPDGQNPAWPKRGARGAQAGSGVKAVILLAGEPIRTIVHVEQDCVERSARLRNLLGNIAFDDADPGIFEAAFEQVRQGPARRRQGAAARPLEPVVSAEFPLSPPTC